jgi:ATP synthase assembly factor FMC1
VSLLCPLLRSKRKCRDKQRVVRNRGRNEGGLSTAEASIFRRNSFKHSHTPSTIAYTSTITHSHREPTSRIYSLHLNQIQPTLNFNPSPHLDSINDNEKRTSTPFQPKPTTQTTMSTPTPNTLRSLYRSLLRELPPRTSPTPSPLATHLRSTFASASSTTATPTPTNEASATDKPLLHKVQEAEQLAMYLKAQRTYVTLVERYNPGADMSDEERVRLSARRVGMNLPVDYVKE